MTLAKVRLLRIPGLAMTLVALAFGTVWSGQSGSTAPAAAALQQPSKPDLAVMRIEFRKVKHLKNATGEPCEVFNLQPVIVNRGKEGSGAFKVLLEREQGSRGAWAQACPLCYWKISGLGAGKTVLLEVRQFNNCGGRGSSFRVTVDSESQIAESNEHNNQLTATYQGSQNDSR